MIVDTPSRHAKSTGQIESGRDVIENDDRIDGR